MNQQQPGWYSQNEPNTQWTGGGPQFGGYQPQGGQQSVPQHAPMPGPQSVPPYPQQQPPAQYSSPPPQYSPPTHVTGPSSGPPAQPQAQPEPWQQTGYVLGVDLGTSHTVAVVRWPDGRTRPLLVDGAPVMPSAIFMDESGHMHVGRDAQRLAQTDPTRYEPNPKSRIADTTVLLGDREVPTAAMLAAVLGNVARKAVEAVGHLPPTVLTCPSKWGPQRRAILEDAAAKAGFPPVKMVPEPVAAAHYFAEVMRQPIPVGASIGIFDFGGGTLDVAVVTHEQDGTFSVQADGGLDDLGGLDIDSAIVQHLGRTIGANAPHVWQQLTQPQNGTDRRNRRLFWDDVRGAKEMLSRTTVAPVPIPGVEASLHLTREELEQLATPLLERAVDETNRVVQEAGLDTGQLSGIFLVGGASRIPLASRMLHTKLGIAPTVLEQPELPVAEGSLVAAFPLQPQTAPTSPGPAVGGQPPQFVPQSEPNTRKRWYRRKAAWIAIAAGVVALAVLAGFLLYERYPQYDMHALEEVGKPVVYPGDDDGVPNHVGSTTFEDTAVHLTEADDGYYVTAIDMTTGETKWEKPTHIQTEYTDHARVDHYADEVVHVTTYDISDEGEVNVIDLESGELRDTITAPGSGEWITNEAIVIMQDDKAGVVGYDQQGSQKWKQDLGFEVVQSGTVESWDEYEFPTMAEGKNIWFSDAEGTVKVVDPTSGDTVAEEKLGNDETQYYAHAGKLVSVTADDSPTVSVFDIEDGLASVGTVRVDDAGEAPNDLRQLQVCGETRVCVWGDISSEDATDPKRRMSVVDIGEDPPTVAWQTDPKESYGGVSVAGESVLLYTSAEEPGEMSTVTAEVRDAEGRPVGDDAAEGAFVPVDSGSFLKTRGDGELLSTSEIVDHAFVGVGAQDGTIYQLGSKEIIPVCGASDTYVSCPTEEGFATWSYR